MNGASVSLFREVTQRSLGLKGLLSKRGLLKYNKFYRFARSDKYEILLFRNIITSYTIGTRLGN